MATILKYNNGLLLPVMPQEKAQRNASHYPEGKVIKMVDRFISDRMGLIAKTFIVTTVMLSMAWIILVA